MAFNFQPVTPDPDPNRNVVLLAQQEDNSQQESTTWEHFRNWNLSGAGAKAIKEFKGFAWEHFKNIREIARERLGSHQPQNPAIPKKSFTTPPIIWDALAVESAYFTPERFPRLRQITEAAAYFRITNRICEAIGSKATAQLSALATAADCVLPRLGIGEQFLLENPKVQNVLTKARYASYASLAWSLAKTAYTKYQGYLESPESRAELLNEFSSAAKALFKGRQSTDKPQARVPRRYDTKFFMEAVQSFDTDGMSLETLNNFIKVGQERNDHDHMPEIEVWCSLLNPTTAYEQQVQQDMHNAWQAIVQAQQTCYGTPQASIIHPTAENIMALEQSHLDYARLVVAKNDRTCLSVFLSNPSLPEISSGRKNMDKLVRSFAMYNRIYSTLTSNLAQFADGIVNEARILPAEDREIFSDNLRAVLKAIPPLSTEMINEFIKLTLAFDAEGLKKKFVNPSTNWLGSAVPAILQPVNLSALRKITHDLAVVCDQDSSKILADFSSRLGRVVASDPLKQPLEQKIKAVGTLKQESETRLWKRAHADMLILKTLSKRVKISKQPPLYPDLQTIIDPESDSIYIAQMRSNKATFARTTLDGLKRSIGSNNRSRVVEDDAGHETMYFVLGIDEMIEKVLTEDKEKTTHTERLVPLRDPNTDFVALHYQKQPTLAALQRENNNKPLTPGQIAEFVAEENCNHRLTAEAFRATGLFVMKQLMKQFVDGTIQTEDLDKLRRRIEFLDIINNNHFVNNLTHTAPFTDNPQDQNYMNHMRVFKEQVRGYIVDQIAERASISSTATTAVDKASALAPRVFISRLFVDKQQKAALNHHLDVLQGVLYLNNEQERPLFPHPERYLETVSLGEQFISPFKKFDMRVSAVKNAYFDLLYTKGKLLKEFNLAACIMSTPQRMSWLQRFYENAYFLKYALENQSICNSVVPKMLGGQEAADQLLAGLKQALDDIRSVYQNYAKSIELGSDIPAIETYKKQEKIREIAEMQASAHFRLNGFEKPSKSAADTVLGWFFGK